MKKNTKLPSLVILLILTLITTVFWVSFNIYRVFTTNPAPVVPAEVILQIDPKLDTETINTMKNKNYPTNDAVVPVTATPLATPVATIEPAVTVTPTDTP